MEDYTIKTIFSVKLFSHTRLIVRDNKIFKYLKYRREFFGFV